MAKSKEDIARDVLLLNRCLALFRARGAGAKSRLASEMGVTIQALSEWWERGIPRHARTKVEALLSRHLGYRPGVSEDPPLEGEPPEGLTREAWNAICPLLAQLRDIWEARDIPGHRDRWQAIVWNIETFASHVRRDMDPGVRKRISLREERKMAG